MANASTRAHVASPIGMQQILVTDPAIEIPQTSTSEASDSDDDESLTRLSRKQRRKQERRQNKLQKDTTAVPEPAIPTPDDTDEETTTLPQSKKERRKQKRQKHDSAQPTPTNTDSESPPTQLRKPQKQKRTSTPTTTAPALPPSLSMAKSLQTAYPLLVCSIGNPGPTYANTLHSAGHMLTTSLSQAKSYTPFTKGMSGLVSRPSSTHLSFSLLGYKRVAADAPDIGADWTFWQSTSLMNVSGNGVKKAYNEWLRGIRSTYGNSTLEGRLVVVHDELEGALGKVTVRDGAASPKGHNGLKSCQQQLGGVKWWRVGVGIGRPESRDPNVVSKYVLGKMTSFQRGQLEKCTIPVYRALEDVAAGKK
jgi:PTH1 family peptidyl-tRNA hydrolase